jgi:hypothetical protein
MSPKMRESLTNAGVTFLNRVTLALLPPNVRPWAQALIAEQQEITNGWERLTWAAGGIVMSVKELLRTLFSDWQVDRFDVFYGLVPCTVGAVIGLVLRSLASRWFKPASH